MHRITALNIPADHPAFAGHFPGTPLLPGAALLDEVLRVIELTDDTAISQVATAKFLKPVLPGETLELEHEAFPNGSIRFVVRSGAHAVATGTLIGSHPQHELRHAQPSA